MERYIKLIKECKKVGDEDDRNCVHLKKEGFEFKITRRLQEYSVIIEVSVKVGDAEHFRPWESWASYGTSESWNEAIELFKTTQERAYKIKGLANAAHIERIKKLVQ